MSMKLSEALALRADTQKRIMQRRERLRAGALVQEGETPPEDPQELLAELDRLLGQHYHVLAYRFVERVGQGHVRPKRLVAQWGGRCSDKAEVVRSIRTEATTRRAAQ
jgi:hypothetical protein